MARNPTSSLPGEVGAEKPARRRRGEGQARLRDGYIVYRIAADGTVEFLDITRDVKKIVQYIGDTSGVKTHKFALG